MRRYFFIVLLFSLVIFPTPGIGQSVETLTVFAASSLTHAFEEIAVAFEIENPNVDILFNFAGSSTLAAQIIEGAPGDVFASANMAQMQRLVGEGLISGEPLSFALNRLVLLLPADNPANIKSLHDLANPNINLIVAATDVPVRTYTDTMLERLAADVSFGEDYRTSVLANIVSEEPNVRQVSAKVILGEADAGIVYRSDVTPDIVNSVITLSIPDEFNTIATYPIASVSDSSQPELAQQFIEFVLSDTGQDILETWQFISIRRPEANHEIPVGTKRQAVGYTIIPSREPED